LRFVGVGLRIGRGCEAAVEKSTALASDGSVAAMAKAILEDLNRMEAPV